MVSIQVDNNSKVGFDEIWMHHPERQNRFSSSWWFFLLYPKQDTGYGPKQMMFSYAGRMSKYGIGVNSTWLGGIDKNRKLGTVEEFWMQLVGWYSDGKEMEENVLSEPILCTLDTEKQHFEGWREENGKTYGGKISASKENPIGMDAEFIGVGGEAKFSIWTDPKDEFGGPQINILDSPKKLKLGNIHVVAWRKFDFKGEFKFGDGKQTLKGIGYFQRVLSNFALPPWKWAYHVFADGSTYSCFIVYFGLQNFRRSYKFYPQILERMVKNLAPSAYFYNAKTNEIILFDRAEVVPELTDTHPNFYIKAENKKTGNKLMFYVETHSKSTLILERRLLNAYYQSRWFYNEYLYEITKMKGTINGKRVDINTFGRGWGNMEYTWGMSI